MPKILVLSDVPWSLPTWKIHKLFNDHDVLSKKCHCSQLCSDLCQNPERCPKAEKQEGQVWGGVNDGCCGPVRALSPAPGVACRVKNQLRECLSTLPPSVEVEASRNINGVKEAILGRRFHPHGKLFFVPFCVYLEWASLKMWPIFLPTEHLNGPSQSGRWWLAVGEGGGRQPLLMSRGLLNVVSNDSPPAFERGPADGNGKRGFYFFKRAERQRKDEPGQVWTQIEGGCWVH